MEGFIFGILRYSLNSYRLFQGTPLIRKGYTKENVQTVLEFMLCGSSRKRYLPCS